jgi:hypothetical protein
VVDVGAGSDVGWCGGGISGVRLGKSTRSAVSPYSVCLGCVAVLHAESISAPESRVLFSLDKEGLHG